MFLFNYCSFKDAKKIYVKNWDDSKSIVDKQNYQIIDETNRRKIFFIFVNFLVNSNFFLNKTCIKYITQINYLLLNK